MDKTVILNNPKEFFKLAIEPSNIIKAINMINDLIISLTYYQHDNFAEVMGNTNWPDTVRCVPIIWELGSSGDAGE
uniref:Uncharacterized protein n=1 Tax=Romanomermis culicivorax TaxID=13658 RepID=A0A915KPU4_ROMCU